MKIALCCRVSTYHRPGGMPYVLEDRAYALGKLGHEVHVLTTSQDIRQLADRIVTNFSVTYHFLPSPPNIYSRQYAQGCLEHCRDWKPDIVHSDSFDASAPWWMNLGYPCKTACTLHGFAWGALLTQWNLYRLGQRGSVEFNPASFLRERNALATFDTVIGISLHEHWMLTDLFGLPARLVYNPIAPYFFDSVTEPKRDVPVKERVFLCASISGQDVRQFETARQAAKVAGVIFKQVSNVPRTRMPEVYDACTALVVPTAYAQGYDLTVAEALARRRPVITSATGSYLRESQALPNANLWTVPLGADTQQRLTDLMTNLPQFCRGLLHEAEQHRPEVHAERWLEAILS